jgi:hypothetical protein
MGCQLNVFRQSRLGEPNYSLHTISNLWTFKNRQSPQFPTLFLPWFSTLPLNRKRSKKLILSLVKVVYQRSLIELPFLLVRIAKSIPTLKAFTYNHQTVESLYKETLRWAVPVPLSMLIGTQCSAAWTENLIYFRPPTSLDGG